jgi:hypothetical protein
MINEVAVTNHLGETITLELRSPEKSGLLVKAIDGLGPCRATINTTELATRDGSIFNSSRVSSRNIVMTLGIFEIPEATVEQLRHITYKYFPIKKQVLVRIDTDDRVGLAIGYVEDNVVDIFNRNVQTTISIICPSPYFYSNFKTVTQLSGVDSGFEFPFSNESLTEPMIQFGSITLISEHNIPYSGDADAGLEIFIKVLGTATGINVYNVTAGQSLGIDTDVLEDLTGQALGAGDELIISTVRGAKSVRLFRDGVYTNVLNCLTADSSWFQLSKGDNIFTFTADTGAGNLQLRIENYTLYEGV